jgi:hypothetical protein
MRERAGLVGGTLEIETAPQGGTTVFAACRSSSRNKNLGQACSCPLLCKYTGGEKPRPTKES